jgi:anthranilate/para-aminobenzoate synthase component I
MKINPDRERFLLHARHGTRVPVVMELPLGSITPIDLYASVRDEGPGVLLESGKGGRYSYVVPSAEHLWTSHGTACTLDKRVTQGNPFDLLAEELSRAAIVPNERLENFSGGIIGYFGYDMARHIEHLPEIATDDLHLPESCFLFIDRFYEIDHRNDILRIVHLPELDGHPIEEQYSEICDVLRQMESAIGRTRTPSDRTTGAPAAPSPVMANFTPEEFAEIVRRAKEYIFAGDIFQVNLSVRFRREFRLDPFFLYRTLRRINPAPYMSFFELPDLAIVSASPELLLKVHDRVIETRPIAGTRPRGESRREDLQNARELIENEKERAEHLMLVDLERNDIGRVARYGSVEVNEFMAIEEYSHVIHIVSNVRGELADGRSTFDAIRACFPGGTITGAPKVRSMEIIEELEPCRRAIYTGSIGWIGYDGDAELNIAIRTILLHDGVAYMQAGAGIVADSVPELEYLESARKAEAALQAVRMTIEENNESVDVDPSSGPHS